MQDLFKILEAKENAIKTREVLWQIQVSTDHPASKTQEGSNTHHFQNLTASFCHACKVYFLRAQTGETENDVVPKS